MPRIIIGIYLVTGAVHVAARLIGWPDVDHYTKPLLMPLLLYLLYRMASGSITFPRLLLAIALIFSWTGDLLLMGSEDVYFLGGLVSFLLAQLIYVTVLYRSTFRTPKFRFLYMIPIGLYGIVLLGLILPNAGKMGVAIVIYGLGILTMVFMASVRRGYTNNSSYFLALVGAVLFVISDSLIAIDKFHTVMPYSGVFVMGTYIPAQ